MEFHIQWNDPLEPHWPKGAWSVYRITGDQIADRTVRASVNVKRGHYEGDVIARHPWCGYVGMFETWVEIAAAIKPLVDNCATVSLECPG